MGDMQPLRGLDMGKREGRDSSLRERGDCRDGGDGGDGIVADLGYEGHAVNLCAL